MKKPTVNFAGVLDNSTVDYPGRVCAVVYLCGCPFRCPWCQNQELVLGKKCKTADVSRIVAQLRKNFIAEAVCVTGGEPLMQDGAVELLRLIKAETDLLAKVDTNGYFPERLKRALPYLDYLSTDIKAPLDERYGAAVGLTGGWRKVVSNVKKSLSLMEDGLIRKEARTTIVPGIVDSEQSIREIAEVVGEHGFSQYTLQQYRADKTLDPGFEKVKSPTPELMRRLGRAAKETLPKTKVVVVTQQKGFEEAK
jgi:pyruvate formate lyase activating enzyme